jgi:hypothetical protein
LRNIKLSTRNEGKTRGSEGDITQAVVARYAIARNESKVHHPDLHSIYQMRLLLDAPNKRLRERKEQENDEKESSIGGIVT